MPSLAVEVGLAPYTKDLIEQEMLESIYTPGKLVLLASWCQSEAAERWRPRASNAIQSLRNRQVRVIRDYGMFDRREAPQFYEEVRRAS